MSKYSLGGSLRDRANFFFRRNKRHNYYKIAFFSILLLLVIVYNIIFTPAVFEKIVKSGFEKSTNGIIKLHVLKSSLLRGFSIENIEVLSGEDFQRLPILQIEKLNIFYSVYGFFAGDIGLHELGIYNPRISLYHKNNIWNLATLFKSTEKAPKTDSETDKKSGTKNIISLPVKIRAFLKIILTDFNFTINDLNPEGGDTLEAGVKNFNLRTYIITQKFSEIPLNIQMFDLLKSSVVHLDPQKNN